MTAEEQQRNPAAYTMAYTHAAVGASVRPVDGGRVDPRLVEDLATSILRWLQEQAAAPLSATTNQILKLISRNVGAIRLPLPARNTFR